MLKISRILLAASPLDNPAFKAWFGDSKLVDSRGEPIRFYHGTSKDQYFDKFNAGKRGVFFTMDPNAASDYAMVNDSMQTKLDWDTGKYVKKHTQPRVIPVYLKMINPYKMTEEQIEKYTHTQNYAAFQRDIGDLIKMKGYDGIVYPDKSFVVFSPNQIKSAIGNNGQYSQKDNRITASREE